MPLLKLLVKAVNRFKIVVFSTTILNIDLTNL